MDAQNKENRYTANAIQCGKVCSDFWMCVDFSWRIFEWGSHDFIRHPFPVTAVIQKPKSIL
jgi:hypothetical protein